MIKNIIKNNYKNIIIFCMSFVLFLIINVIDINSALNYDNIWNFHMMQKVFLGYIPYKEINVIITPLFHFLGSVFLNIFGNNFFAFYIYGAIILAVIATLSYILLKKITIHKEFILVGMSGLLLILQYIHIPNYNGLIIIFPLILTLLEFKRDKLLAENKNKTKKIDYIIGCVMGLCFLTKQTVGGVFCLAYFIYLIIYDKTRFKVIDIKSLLRKISGALLIVFPFLAYLIYTNSFIDFLDLCFGGIIDFGQKNSTGSFLGWQTIITLGVSSFSFMLFYHKREEIKLLLLGIFSLASVALIMPLANEFHIYTSIIITIITITYILDLIYKNSISTKFKKCFLTISYIIGVLGLMFLIINSDKNIEEIEKIEIAEIPVGLETYKGCIEEEELYDEILNVNKYIKQKENEGYNVFILSPSASLYMIPSGKNNYKFDLILQGNLGFRGEERLVEEIKKIENPLFLKQEELIFQESVIIDEFIKNNYDLIDEIENFKVYVNQNNI